MKHSPIISQLTTGLRLLVGCILIMLLSFLPVPSSWAVFRLLYPVLMVLYWSTLLPNQVSLMLSWLFGLSLDALYGSLLGTHALALILFDYASQRIVLKFYYLSFLKRMGYLWALLVVYQCLLYWLQSMRYLMSIHLGWQFTWTSLISALGFYSLIRRQDLMDKNLAYPWLKR